MIVTLLILLGGQAYSQRVAVVLSGGGAKGLSHVGVLQALEEYEIPIDYIVGTSMGAIVGGLYASGYSPDTIAMMLQDDKFTKWATGEIDNKYSYYFKQAASDASWISIKFNYNDVTGRIKGQLPMTMIPTYEMDFNILELYAGASAAANYDFNDLFVPFRCVASDIDSNRAVILDHGQLGTAVRASMTFPFYYKPIEVDGKLLFDGGMYNNFPSDVALEAFYPDVIIGSKAVGNFNSPDQEDMISQLQSMLMAPADFRLDSNSGILLEHDLDNRNIFDYSKAGEVIDVGYQTVLDNLGGIYDLIDRRVPLPEVRSRRAKFFEAKPPLEIDSIFIEGLNKNQAEYVRKLFKHRDRTVDIESVKMQYFALIADDKISSIFPELLYNPHTGFYDLHLKVKKSESFVGVLGGNVSSGTSNEAFVGIEYRYLGRQAMSLKANLYLGRFYNSYMVGARVDFPSRVPFFMDLSYIYNSKNYFRNATYFFDDKTPSFLICKESFGSLSFGIPASHRGKFVLGANFGGRKDEYYQNNQFSREDTADITSFDMVSPYLKFELNSLNRKQYANAGARFLAEVRYTYGSEIHTPGSTSVSSEQQDKYHSWAQLRLLYDNYFDHLGPLALGFYGELLISNQDFFYNYTSSILAAPAFEPVLESKTLFLPKYRAYNYGAVGMKFVLDIYRKVDVRLEGYLFQPYQEILSDDNMEAVYGKEFAYRSVIASSSVVWHSPLGPLSLSVNYYDRNNDKFSFFFNFGYIIFNQSISK
jgi:NTE family protein